VNRIVAVNLLFLTPLALIPAVFVWTWPSWENLAWLAVMAGAATTANWLTVHAFSLADTTAVLPYDFMRLPFVAALAFLLFGEVPDLWTWVGAAVIFLSSFYIARREAQLRRANRDAAIAPKIT
jgi:S-adenosylmethionine uptake transporter